MGGSAPQSPSGECALGASAKVKWLAGVPGALGRARREASRTRERQRARGHPPSCFKVPYKALKVLIRPLKTL